MTLGANFLEYESKDAIRIRKILNIVGQSKYRDVAKEVLCRVRNEYDGYQNLIEDIRNMRDKIYVHNGKTLYKDWDFDRDATLDDPLWGRRVELLKRAKDSILLLRSAYGDNFPLYFEAKNDVKNLLSYDALKYDPENLPKGNRKELTDVVVDYGNNVIVFQIKGRENFDNGTSEDEWVKNIQTEPGIFVTRSVSPRQ